MSLCLQIRKVFGILCMVFVALASSPRPSSARQQAPEPQVVRPATIASLKGDQIVRCQLRTSRPAAVDVWIVSYRPPQPGKPREFNNGPVAFPLDAEDAGGLVWSGTVDLDSPRISAAGHGAGYFLFCHATYLGDPHIDDPAVANAISKRARSAKRILERP